MQSYMSGSFVMSNSAESRIRKSFSNFPQRRCNSSQLSPVYSVGTIHVKEKATLTYSVLWCRKPSYRKRLRIVENGTYNQRRRRQLFPGSLHWGFWYSDAFPRKQQPDYPYSSWHVLWPCNRTDSTRHNRPRQISGLASVKLSASSSSYEFSYYFSIHFYIIVKYILNFFWKFKI